MSQRVEHDIEINDLPPAEPLTPEEKERLAGAGRFRPTFEALETRQLMSATGFDTVAGTQPPSGGTAGQFQPLETTSATTVSAPTSTAAATPVFNADFNQPAGTFPLNNGTWYSDDAPGQNRDRINNNVKYDNDYVDGQGRRTLEVVDELNATDGKALAMTILPADEKGTMRSARINTAIDPVAGNLEYGRIEARIKMPAGEGTWPAFWMLGAGHAKPAPDYEPWPACGEIDIMEFWGDNPNQITGTLVMPSPDADLGRELVQNTYNLPNGQSFSSDYHTFGINWSPEFISFSVDGHVYKTLYAKDYPASDHSASWNFDKPFYIVLNVSATDSGVTAPQTMLVDYVRAYSWSPVDLSGQDLTKMDLSAVDLRCANLSGANLTGVDLSGRNLSGANLQGAILNGTNFTGAIMWGANLSGNDLRETILIEAKLGGANLTHANLSKCNLSGANLSGAQLYGADMSWTNLSGTDLRDTPLGGADWTGSNLLTGAIYQ